MTDRLRDATVPAYLFLCLLLGGSAQGVWGSAILRLLAVMIIAWALIERRDQSLPRGIRHLLIIIALGLVLALLQLVPLPAGIWSSLPGREPIVAGLSLLGLEPGAMPVSLAPYAGLATLIALLPPLGMLAALIAFRDTPRAWLAAALVAGTVAGVLLGILQASSPDPQDSPWYLYQHSNFGAATGFFANSNHMASLLLVTIPFIAALGARVRDKAGDIKQGSAALAVVGGGMAVVVLGLALNGSLAGYGLGIPVLLGSLIMLFRPPARLARTALLLAGIAGLVAIGLVWANPIDDQPGARSAAISLSTRREIVANGLDLAGQYAPVGSGLGTFEQVYAFAEDPAGIDRYRINHAHNDYLELAIETGVPGIVLMLLFLAWWAASVRNMLRSPAADEYAVAAAIASAAVLLHSAVDYPLRTAAVSAVFAMCVVLIVQSRRTARTDRDLRPVRHLAIG